MVSTDLNNKQSTSYKNTELKFCEKCGSVLVNRVIMLTSKRKQKIYQCIVCRHWYPA